MNRTAWLQDCRMQKFRNVLNRWEREELSAQEAGEILGVSERQFNHGLPTITHEKVRVGGKMVEVANHGKRAGRS